MYDYMKIFKKILKTQRVHEFVEVNEHPVITGNCICAVNHSCKWDSQYLMELLPKRFSLLAGKQRLKIVDRMGFLINGAIWVDRKNKASRHKSKEKMLKKLGRGKSLLIFPEGTWNLEPSKPMLPLFFGIIEIAQKTNAPIIPLCLEYVEDKCVIKYADVLTSRAGEDKVLQIENLRDTMATLKWEIWEMFPTIKRAELADDYWDKEVAKRLGEYKLLDYEYEMSCVRKE